MNLLSNGNRKRLHYIFHALKINLEMVKQRGYTFQIDERLIDLEW